MVYYLIVKGKIVERIAAYESKNAVAYFNKKYGLSFKDYRTARNNDRMFCDKSKGKRYDPGAVEYEYPDVCCRDSKRQTRWRIIRGLRMKAVLANATESQIEIYRQRMDWRKKKKPKFNFD